LTGLVEVQLSRQLEAGDFVVDAEHAPADHAPHEHAVHEKHARPDLHTAVRTVTGGA